ncbi:class I SAM-dependent methyltransferase [Chromobacterium sp. CV08]|uniref:class I SAM-dependent methyltransferase n=1 Tax=Chromobacterium sp. CV08 TaxID=3133274 RepID=UPI003DA99E9A
MDSIHQAASQGFSKEAQAYERGRPAYSPALAGWLRDSLGVDAATAALDLGAGTGKFTRLLATVAGEVVAVEPVDEMRAELQASLPGLRALKGTAEAIPLPDASVDVVTCAQAFHWFAGEDALREIHRVLRACSRSFCEQRSPASRPDARRRA